MHKLILSLLLIFVFSYSTQSFTRTELKINQVKQFNTTQCHVVTLNPLMKKVRLSINNIHNVRSVVISQSPLAFDCNAETVLEDCNHKDFCLSFTDIKQSLEVSVGFCTDTIYMYISPQRYSISKSSFTIFSKYLPSSCNSITQTPYTKCGKYSSSQCLETCHEGCIYVGCRSRQFSQFQFGLCLPDNLKEQQYMNRCQMDTNVSAYNIIDACKQDSYKQKSTVHIILIVIFLILTVILVSAVHYRYKLISTGNPPYNVPNFMPEFLFPRTLNRQGNQNNLRADILS